MRDQGFGLQQLVGGLSAGAQQGAASIQNAIASAAQAAQQKKQLAAQAAQEKAKLDQQLSIANADRDATNARAREAADVDLLQKGIRRVPAGPPPPGGPGMPTLKPTAPGFKFDPTLVPPKKGEKIEEYADPYKYHEQKKMEYQKTAAGVAAISKLNDAIAAGDIATATQIQDKLNDAADGYAKVQTGHYITANGTTLNPDRVKAYNSQYGFGVSPSPSPSPGAPAVPPPAAAVSPEEADHEDAHKALVEIEAARKARNGGVVAEDENIGPDTPPAVGSVLAPGGKVIPPKANDLSGLTPGQRAIHDFRVTNPVWQADRSKSVTIPGQPPPATWHGMSANQREGTPTQARTVQRGGMTFGAAEEAGMLNGHFPDHAPPEFAGAPFADDGIGREAPADDTDTPEGIADDGNDPFAGVPWEKIPRPTMQPPGAQGLRPSEIQADARGAVAKEPIMKGLDAFNGQATPSDPGFDPLRHVRGTAVPPPRLAGSTDQIPSGPPPSNDMPPGMLDQVKAMLVKHLPNLKLPGAPSTMQPPGATISPVQQAQASEGPEQPSRRFYDPNDLEQVPVGAGAELALNPAMANAMRGVLDDVASVPGAADLLGQLLATGSGTRGAFPIDQGEMDAVQEGVGMKSQKQLIDEAAHNPNPVGMIPPEGRKPHGHLGGGAIDVGGLRGLAASETEDPANPGQLAPKVRAARAILEAFARRGLGQPVKNDPPHWELNPSLREQR